MQKKTNPGQIIAKYKLSLALILILILGFGVVMASTQSDPIDLDTNQGSQFSINQFTIDAGAGTSSAVDFSLRGTIAQTDITIMQTGQYVLRGGFWYGTFGLSSDLIFLDGFD